jgi:hypothetical protein
MDRRLGGNIVKSQHPVVFVDFFAGNFPGDNFAENTIAHNKQV